MAEDDKAHVVAQVDDIVHALGYRSLEEYQAARQRVRDSLSEEQEALLDQWLQIGNENPWIGVAVDPPFDETSFHFCETKAELMEKLLQRWVLGQAFVWGQICFINQVDGGDEWLTIKGSTPFYSITMRTPGETVEAAQERLLTTLERIEAATEEQCRALEY